MNENFIMIYLATDSSSTNENKDTGLMGNENIMKYFATDSSSANEDRSM